jgi:signal peptidase I
MVPTFFKGDMMIVYGDKDVSVGDIIVFDAPDRKYPIIHRIYGMNNGEIKTKGDHNQYVDPWIIYSKNLHGKAIIKVPLLGWVKILFTEFTGIA